MTKLYADNLAAFGTTPVGLVDGSLHQARVRAYHAKITLASQTTSDTIVIAKPSKGETFLMGFHATDTSLGSSTVAIGITGATTKYKTAATFTTADTPTIFPCTAIETAMTQLTADEEVFITIGAATMPSSGTYFVTLLFIAA